MASGRNQHRLPLRIDEHGVRSRLLWHDDRLEVALNYYPAGLDQPDHEHRRAQLSLLLAGGFEEASGGSSVTPFGGRQGFKPAGTRHSAAFGGHGALILSIDFAESADVEQAAFAGSGPGRWAESAEAVTALCGTLLAGDGPAGGAVTDLIAAASMSGETPKRLGSPPTWLRRVAERIEDEPDSSIEALAAGVGVHRVHLSRSFQRCFGIAPSLYRLRCKSARAIRQVIVEGEPLSMAAAAGGFVDQSHWTRACRRLNGIGPGTLRALLTA